jgi:hypothetical protein
MPLLADQRRKTHPVARSSLVTTQVYQVGGHRQGYTTEYGRGQAECKRKTYNADVGWHQLCESRNHSTVIGTVIKGAEQQYGEQAMETRGICQPRECRIGAHEG